MAVTFGKIGTTRVSGGARLVCTPDSQIAAPPSPDVTPNPTPNWPNVYEGNNQADTSAQITGIDSTITLSISWTGTGGTFTVAVNNSNTYGGTITTLSSSPTNITVNNNQYVIFRLFTIPFGTFTRNITITNSSDGNTILDTTSITLDYTP